MKMDSFFVKMTVLFISIWLAASPGLPGTTAQATDLVKPAVSLASAQLSVNQQTQQDAQAEGMQQIFSEIEASEYQVTWAEHTYLPELAAGYQAPNRAGGFRTYFTEGGTTIIPRSVPDGEALPWRLDLSLAGWSGGATEQTLLSGSQSVEGNRVDYTRGGLSEWYVNSADGLEQGFTIDSPVGDEAAAASLRFEVGFSTGMQVEQASPSSPVRFLSQDGKEGLKYGTPHATGADSVSLPVTLELSGSQLIVQVDLRQAVYPVQLIVDMTTIGSMPAWDWSGLDFAHHEGLVAATAGDVNGDGYSDIIVGAPYYDSGGWDDRGCVWIYAGDPDYEFVQIFNKLGVQELAWFGFSVGTAGDVNGDGYADVIVGAPMQDGLTDILVNKGAVYIFHGSASGVDTTVDTYIEGAKANANFGYSVAFAGDVNRDTYSDVIVGAPGYYGDGAGQGRAYVYQGSSTGVDTTYDWQASTGVDNANMGWSVATAGDVNGDRYADVLVGIPNNEVVGEYTYGAVFAWYGSADGVNEGTDGTPGNTDWQYGDWQGLGSTVSTAGDVNGDGYSDIILGAPDAASGSGAVVLFLGSSSGLEADYDNYDIGSTAGNHFGYSVALAGDVNCDGYADVIAGAPGEDGDYTEEGRAYVWYGHSYGISGGNDWNSLGGYENASFGWSVATAGDVSGNGCSQFLVTAGGKDGSNAAVRMYSNGGANPTEEGAGWTKASNLETSQFGFSVGTAGDVNGDGYSDIVVGAPFYDGGQENEGLAAVYLGSTTGVQASGYNWLKESNLAGAEFGYSVASAGDVNRDGYDDIIVGAPFWKSSYDGEGGAWVYIGSSTGTVNAPYWYKVGGQEDAHFGFSVAGAGDTNGDGYADVIIGAPDYDHGSTDEGMAWVYRGGPGAIQSAPYFSKDSDLAGAHFGWSVASAGDVNRDGYADIIVGAPYFDGTYTAQGNAFVYTGSAAGITPDANWYGWGSQNNEHYGWSVASAGDVNGDGYSDIIVGAPDYADGQTGEGGVWVYHGSASAVSFTANWHKEAGQSDAFYGFSVGTAGDVNGDGYADVIIGASGMTDDVTDEGTTRVFLGTPGGLQDSIAWRGAGGEQSSYYGYAVGTAGDVNGDGFDDVIVGAPRWGDSTDTAPQDQGKVFVYYGGGGRGVDMRPRQLNADDTPIAHMGMTVHSQFFTIHLLGKNPFGSSRMGYTIEVQPLSSLLNGSGFMVDTPYGSTSWGSEKIGYYIMMVPGTVYHWRAKLRYDPATQPWLPASRWYTTPYHGWNEGDLRTLWLYTYAPIMVR